MEKRKLSEYEIKKGKVSYMDRYLKDLETMSKIGTYGAEESSKLYNSLEDDARITDTEELDKILDMASSGPEMIRAIIKKINSLQYKFLEFLEPIANLKGKIDYLTNHAGEYHNNKTVSSQIDELKEFVKDFEGVVQDFSDQFNFQKNAFEILEKEEEKRHGKKEQKFDF
jgi:DUF1009 family protein